MKFVLYTNALSEHQMPLAREIVKRIGENNFRYIFTGSSSQKLQESTAKDDWIVKSKDHSWLNDADVMLVGGIRPIDLIERRVASGKLTLYMSERWFKPFHGLPGWIRLLVPRYYKMARRFVHLFNSPSYRFLPIGPWSKRDMLFMCKVFRQKFEPQQIIDWGDFVDESSGLGYNKYALPAEKSDKTLKLLWCGRLLGWKRVGDIVRAVGEHVGLKRAGDSLPNISLTIVGDGPEKSRLVKMAKGLPITFHNSVTIKEVRNYMRMHDVYVLSSNAYEGWGCVVLEAIEEGMKVVGTYEAGASAAILPTENLYHAGDWKTLARKLAGDIPYVPIGKWSVKSAAERLLKEVGYEAY